MEGKSGEDEMTTTESSWAIFLAEGAESKPPGTTKFDLLVRPGLLRAALPNRQGRDTNLDCFSVAAFGGTKRM